MFEQRMEIDEKYLKDHILSVQRMIYIEEEKFKAQQELITTLNNIGQAMFKICETLGKKGLIVLFPVFSYFGAFISVNNVHLYFLSF